MSRLECVGKSSEDSQKQLPLEVTTAHAQIHKSDDTVGKKAVTDKLRTPSVHASSNSLQESQESGFVKGEVLHVKEPPPDVSVSINPGVEGRAAASVEDLEMEEPCKPQLSDSAGTGGKTRAPPPVEPGPLLEPHGEEEQTEEEDVQDEGRGAPLELMAEFLGAVMDRDFQLASKLCQMILVYEPENPEARQFLPLIQEKLLEEQENEQSNEDDDDNDDDDSDSNSGHDDDDSDDSGSDEESSQSSSCSSSASSSSSSSSSEDDEEAEQRGNRHKPCPPSNLPP